MKKLGLAIIDDERSARELIRDLLKDTEWVEIRGEASGVDEALLLIRQTRPDVILLDIQMPGKDGFTLIEELVHCQQKPEVIFITAYVKYAIRAMRASAFDYLLKPVRKSELLESLDKLSERVSSQQLGDRFSQLIYHLGDTKKIKFSNRTGFSMIDPEEILFCRADSNYTIVEMAGGKKLTVSMNLGRVEDLLPVAGFVRISRSVIINMHYLVQVNRKSMTCELAGTIPVILKVSRSYMKQLEASCEKHFSIQNGSS